MTNEFSWQNSISLCPASFCTPRPNLPLGLSIPNISNAIRATYLSWLLIRVLVFHFLSFFFFFLFFLVLYLHLGSEQPWIYNYVIDVEHTIHTKDLSLFKKKTWLLGCTRTVAELRCFVNVSLSDIFHYKPHSCSTS